MIDKSNLSVRSAKEQLQAIYGAKDFLRGSQEEFPDMYSHFQKQIDGLTRDESELSSWLRKNGGFDNGGSIWDADEDDYDDAAALEEISHFNDDLYEGGKPRFENLPLDIKDDSDDDWGIPVYDSEGNLLNPIKSGIATKPIPLPNPNDFQAINNGDEKVDSKTAWQIISDWVKADDRH